MRLDQNLTKMIKIDQIVFKVQKIHLKQIEIPNGISIDSD